MTLENGLQARIIRRLEQRGAYVVCIQGGGAGRSGVPDIHATYRGRSLWIEVKGPRGLLEPRQAYEMDKARKAGAVAAVVRSVEEVEAALDEVDEADREDTAA